MASSLFSLLTLPVTSDAFSAVRPSAAAIVDESESPPPLHKVPRLAQDSDPGSASRKGLASAPSKNTARVVRVKISGAHPPSQTDKRDTDLARLQQCIRILLTKDSEAALPLTYESIYATCRYVVCNARDGEALHGRLKAELEKSVGQLQRFLLETSPDGLSWLYRFVDVCAWFETQISLLQSLLTFLDRDYSTSDGTSQSVRGMALDLFSHNIIWHGTIVKNLEDGIKTWIQWERENRKPHEAQAKVAQLIGHLQTHDSYQARFENYYLELIAEHYSAESDRLSSAADKDASAFLLHCTSRIDEEVARSREILPKSSWGAVLEATERALLSDRLHWLAEEGIPKLMKSEDTQGLSRIYHLFFRVDGLKELNGQFKAYVERTVKAVVRDAARDDDMVDRLLKLKAFLDRALQDAFADPVVSAAPSTSALARTPNRDFGYAVTDAFGVGFKARRNKPAEMIAKHVDRMMRKGQRGATDAEFAAQLDAALALYRFTDDKDVFRTFYHRALAKRLLLERSASDDFEKAILKKLKELYDPEFSMGDHMFNDLALSRELMQDYHKKLEQDSSARNLNVMVLQQSFWPFSARTSDADLPPEMQAEIAAFAAFYKGKHQGHKLDWDHGLGTIILTSRFSGGQKELSVSLYQGVVLLLFNRSPKIPFAEIKASTRIEDAELRRTLQSLACGKKKVLKKLPPGRDVDDDDVFEFNDAFTDPRAKVHINSIQVKETVEEAARTQTAIEGDRKHYLDAAIVRIMKARKQLMYEQLKAETIEAVKKHFVPDVSSIKKRIESLVEQDYLKRDEEETNMYVYVA